MLVTKGCLECFPCTVLVNHHHVHGVVGCVVGHDVPEVVGGANGHTVNGHQRVPRLHARLGGTTVDHDALNVNVIVFGYKLRRNAPNQEQRDECGEQICRRPSSKHSEAFSTRCPHQFVGLWLSQGPQRKPAQ